MTAREIQLQKEGIMSDQKKEEQPKEGKKEDKKEDNKMSSPALA